MHEYVQDDSIFIPRIYTSTDINMLSVYLSRHAVQTSAVRHVDLVVKVWCTTPTPSFAGGDE